MLIISGAFGVFRRETMIEVGGYAPHSLAEDADVVARMHRILRRRGVDYRITFVTEPVCWTEVPETFEILGRQRRRWSRGLADLLWTYRSMIGNPRYGRIGIVVYPYYLLFECLGPVIELVGFLTLVLGLVFGLLNVPFAVLFCAVALGYGVFLSLASLALEEMSFRRYRHRRELMWLVAAAFVENVGFRQIHAWWRLRGLILAIRRHEVKWEPMVRIGFGASTELDSPTQS
jgi:cellulose synthase/poly-beta-1,6-N-acetylglucosamine synthase-like glycosyltransferase